MKAVSVRQMRGLDKRTIEKAGIPGIVLMERAGTGAAQEIINFAESISGHHVRRFVILAGKGNNGGDAYVVARYLYENYDVDIHVYSVCAIEELRGDAGLNADRLPGELRFKISNSLSPEDFMPGDIIIDGLLGTGINGTLRPPYDKWIELVNSLDLPVVSLDIPSGLNGDTGRFATTAVKADMTVMMGLPKKGLVSEKIAEYCGKLRCIDIGIPQKFTDEIESDLEVNFAEDIRPFIGRVPIDSHKGSRGKLAVIGGSRAYAGAPFLAAEAAMRSGAGYVRLIVPDSVPRSMCSSYSLIVNSVPAGKSGTLAECPVKEINSAIADADALVIGPGMTKDASLIPVLEKIRKDKKPLVFDADALNLAAENPDIILKCRGEKVLTPHPGEMQRLLKGFKLKKLQKSDRIKQARALAEKTSSVVVLKGCRTVIASPDQSVTVNGSGSPALAVMGTGDVLSGMIGTFLAQGIKAYDAARTAVFIHGLAGEMSPAGIRGLTADDLILLIPEAMKEISPFA